MNEERNSRGKRKNEKEENFIAALYQAKINIDSSQSELCHRHYWQLNWFGLFIPFSSSLNRSLFWDSRQKANVPKIEFIFLFASAPPKLFACKTFSWPDFILGQFYMSLSILRIVCETIYLLFKLIHFFFFFESVVSMGQQIFSPANNFKRTIFDF